MAVPARHLAVLARRAMRIIARFAKVAVRPLTVKRNAVFAGAYRHQGRQRRNSFVIGEPRFLIGEPDHLDLHDRLVVMRFQGRADSSHLDELSNPDLLRIGVEAEHEMRGEVLFEDRQSFGPSTFGRMKDARSRGVEEHRVIKMGYAAYLSYRKFPCLIQPGLDRTGHRVPLPKKSGSKVRFHQRYA